MPRFQLAALIFVCATEAFGVSIDATRAEVVAELGKPRSSAIMGEQEILQYPNGVRIELTRGHVSGARGLALSVAPTPAPDTVLIPPPATSATPVPTAPAIKPTAPPQSPASVPEVENETTVETPLPKLESLEKAFSKSASQSQASLEKTLDATIAQHDSPRPIALSHSFDPLRFATELLLKCLMTVIALKLACKYWGAEVFWSSILTVAVVDAVVRAGLLYLGQKLLGFPTLFYADDAIGGIVMVLMLRQLSINRSLAQAVQLVLTTKTFTVIVGAFLISVLLSRMH